MTTLEDFNDIDHDAVLDAMSDRGISLSWEYPGVAAITLDDTHEVRTGLHSYAYGDISVLRDGCWEPVEDGEGAAEVYLEEYETDPKRIAAAWAAWVNGWAAHP